MKNKGGYFLIEALLSIVIFSVLILSVFSMISFLQRRTVQSGFEAEATLLLQEGIEIAHTVVLGDWSGYSDNTYYPVFDADHDAWILLPGEETGLEALYSRKIELRRVCRDGEGEIAENNSPCFGTVDSVTREVIATVGWDEKDNEREISARLLILNTNE